MLKASQEWCSWSFLLLQRRQTLLCVLKASQVWCGWSFFLPQRHHPLLCVLKVSQVWCGWSFLKDVVVPKVLSKVWVMLKVPQRCGCSRRILKGCGYTLHLSYTLKTLYFFFIPSNSLFHAKDDAVLHLQNVATTAPSRFSKVSLYEPSRTWVNFR